MQQFISSCLDILKGGYFHTQTHETNSYCKCRWNSSKCMKTQGALGWCAKLVGACWARSWSSAVCALHQQHMLTLRSFLIRDVPTVCTTMCVSVCDIHTASLMSQRVRRTSWVETLWEQPHIASLLMLCELSRIQTVHKENKWGCFEGMSSTGTSPLWTTGPIQSSLLLLIFLLFHFSFEPSYFYQNNWPNHFV